MLNGTITYYDLTTHQSLADLQQHIGVVQSSAMILPRQLDVSAGFGILPRYVVILSVICHWSDGRGQWVDEWVLSILTNLVHYLTWQSLSINCVTIVTWKEDFLELQCYDKAAWYLKAVKFVSRAINVTPTNTHFKLYHLVTDFPLYHACFIETSK